MITQINDPSIRAILLFGSRARGDATAGSDTDMAVFAEADSISSLLDLRVSLDSAKNDPSVNFSIYSCKTAQKMASEGSLYLWHLRLEGKLVLNRGTWLSQLFRNLRPYSAQKAMRDLVTFRAVLQDIDGSLATDDTAILYEAATMFSILRSLGMMVSMLRGSPTFGRLEPIEHLRTALGGIEISQEEIEHLLTSKLVYSRKKLSLIQLFNNEYYRGLGHRSHGLIGRVERTLYA